MLYVHYSFGLPTTDEFYIEDEVIGFIFLIESLILN